ncbi:MAG: hypothetical protein K6G18_06555 [Treponema sp.]|nr:hypothetical protein [Treponema sp.]
MEYNELFDRYKDKVFKAFSLLTEEDVRKLEKEDYEILITVKRLKKKREVEVSLIDYSQVLDSILSVSSKPDAEQIINEKLKNKNDILGFARYVKVQAQTKDSVKILTSRIIESTIGAKLRSDAIHGGLR